MGATMHLEDWEKVAMKIMKVASTSDIPQPLDSDGIAIAPYYNKDNANYTSKVQRSAAYRSVVEGWLVEDEARVNKELLEALNAGVSAPLLYVYDSCNLDVLLKDVGAQYIGINWIVEGNPSILLDRWMQWALNQGLELEQLSGAIPHDLFEIWLRTGNWMESESADWTQWQSLLEHAPSTVHVLGVHTNAYHHAGATPVQELGIALASLNEYAEHLLHGVSWPGAWVNFALSSDFFHDIAKLRAFRQLYAIWVSEREIDMPNGDGSKLWIHAQTGLRDKDLVEPTNNLVRNTWQTMAAWLGGADEIWTKPHDDLEGGTPFARRIARNVNNLLVEESAFGQLEDAASGSFFLEHLSREMVKEAWEFFCEIEAEGGMTKALKSGFIQNRVEEAGKDWVHALAEKKRILVGVNRYEASPRAHQPAPISSTPESKANKKRIFPALTHIDVTSLYPSTDA